MGRDNFPISEISTDKMSAVNLQEVHDFLVQVVNMAGEMITSAKPKQTDAGQKKNSADIVTETDQAVEKMVSTTLRDRFPDFECEYLLTFL
jgi:myo-inositol-1(or 4)-monophosphatase